MYSSPAGRPGTGKTATVRELARLAAIGEIPFLRDRRFLWIDVSNVGPEDSRACLETIAAVSSAPPSEPIHVTADEDLSEALGRALNTAFEQAMEEEEDDAESSDVILCLDGVDALLKRPNGGTNKPLLQAMASRPGVQIIGIIDRWAFNDLIAGDAKMLELFTRIDLEEPNEQTAHEILRQKAVEFQRTYELTINNDVLAKTISLASNYVLNECHPSKGIKILRQACDDVDYEATQLNRAGACGPVAVAGVYDRLSEKDAQGSGHGLAESVSVGGVTIADVVRVVSELTGIPEPTLHGETGEADFDRALTEAVVGQERAVQAAATDISDVTQAVYTLNPAGFGSLVSQHRSPTSNFYHFDALGSTNRLTDSSETATAEYIYEAFGRIVDEPAGLANLFTFIGQQGYQYDPQMAQYYLRARFYDPANGRFMSRDPLGLSPDAANLYAYTDGRPTYWIDPSGQAFGWLICLLITAIIAIVLGIGYALLFTGASQTLLNRGPCNANETKMQAANQLLQACAGVQRQAIFDSISDGTTECSSDPASCDAAAGTRAGWTAVTTACCMNAADVAAQLLGEWQRRHPGLIPLIGRGQQMRDFQQCVATQGQATSRTWVHPRVIAPCWVVWHNWGAGISSAC